MAALIFRGIQPAVNKNREAEGYSSIMAHGSKETLTLSTHEATSTLNTVKVELVQKAAACFSRDHWELNATTLGSAFQLEASEILWGLGTWPVG